MKRLQIWRNPGTNISKKLNEARAQGTREAAQHTPYEIVTNEQCRHFHRQIGEPCSLQRTRIVVGAHFSLRMISPGKQGREVFKIPIENTVNLGLYQGECH